MMTIVKRGLLWAARVQTQFRLPQKAVASLLVCIQMVITLRRVGLQYVTGKPVAFGEDFINLVGWPLAVAGRTTRPEG